MDKMEKVPEVTQTQNASPQGLPQSGMGGPHCPAGQQARPKATACSWARGFAGESAAVCQGVGQLLPGAPAHKTKSLRRAGEGGNKKERRMLLHLHDF